MTTRDLATTERARFDSGSATVLRPYVPEVREAAVRAFNDRYSDVSLDPVVVVIAAYNEGESIGRVLDEIPREVGGLPIDTLVIDDGSSDRTTDVSLEHDVYVATLARNCGQGVALRLGYQLAREHGARFIATLDGDGQWNPAEIPAVLEPLLAGEADFVIGSRILGGTETEDSFRQAGVHVFSSLIRLLTGVRVTDTSSGLRAMRAEVTETVRQEQVQYQTSELLIGAIYQGYRITERPVVMRKRTAGESKKGHNLIYGFRYARVILKTWWRESRAASDRPEDDGAHGVATSSTGAGSARAGDTGETHPEGGVSGLRSTRSARAITGFVRALPVLRAVAFLGAVAIVVVMAARAASEVDLDAVAWWPLPLASIAAATWWVLTARGWSLLLMGRSRRRERSMWYRTQALRYLPGGIWAPASRVAVVHGSLLDRVSTVAAENVVALCAALAIGGVALASAGDLRWLPLAVLVAGPVLGARFLARRTRITPARTLHATWSYLAGYLAYAAAAVLVQGAVSGFHDALAVAGAAAVAWSAGFVVVITPGGIGVREVVYVALLAGLFPTAELAAGAVMLRVVTVLAELGVLVVAGRPGSQPPAVSGHARTTVT